MSKYKEVLKGTEKYEEVREVRFMPLVYVTMLVLCQKYIPKNVVETQRIHPTSIFIDADNEVLLEL